jgi:hypothetical protein
MDGIVHLKPAPLVRKRQMKTDGGLFGRTVRITFIFHIRDGASSLPRSRGGI